MTDGSDRDADSDPERASNASGDANRLETQIPGIEVTTQLAEGDLDDLEAIHRRQLEWALEHADEAKESTRI